MKARFVLLLLLLSLGAVRLSAQDVPTDAKRNLETAWQAKPDSCLKALRLLVTNSGAVAVSDALGALKEAGFPPGGLLNAAFKNSQFVVWLASATNSDPHDTSGKTKSDAEALVDQIYDDKMHDGITKLAEVATAKSTHPDTTDLTPVLTLLDAVPLGDPTYAANLEKFRAAAAISDAKWSIFDVIAKKINGSK